MSTPDPATRDIFFYGLFMDVGLLEEKGLHPVSVGAAKVRGFRLRIGERATLVRDPGSICYGIVMTLPDEETELLYSAPDVRDYRPEPVEAILLNPHSVRHTICYNLPTAQQGGKANAAYSKKLAELAQALGFPTEYSQEVARSGRD